MEKLVQLKCEVCSVGAPLATQAEIAEFMPQLPGWVLTEDGTANKLEKTFLFDNFVAALAFSNQVGELAEQHGHHPSILTQWGQSTVSWHTHKIKGLHKNDFVMAARTDGLLDNA